MLYGKVIHPKELTDANGSSKQITITYRGGKETMKTRYEQRIRVESEAEELREIIQFRREHPDTIEIRVEKPERSPKAHWHLVLCWVD